jgi:hypothetical protein
MVIDSVFKRLLLADERRGGFLRAIVAMGGMVMVANCRYDGGSEWF